MSDDQPRRSRRSSISEHIQRVFNVDRLDKKRPSDDFQAEARHAALVPKSEITIGFEVGPGSTIAGETMPSSFTLSSQNSRLPSISTPSSSPLVHPVRVQDEDSKQPASDMTTPDMTTLNTNTANHATTADKDLICKSPTWEKEVNRKERRATKRLEAERKELEKRLSSLDEAQLKLEQGIYDRSSRRLTKKQPLGTSARSSSANTERPRSASFTSLFSSKRRSRSRASSMTGSDRESRSSIENGPPTLPLTLPEQFGTAVSRELATRHGTSLVPSHQMTRALHHTTAKSDDLRESWKMAEEWKKKNGGAEPDMDNIVTTRRASFRSKFNRSEKHPTSGFSNGYAPSKAIPAPEPAPHAHSKATELSADLDRDSFTAALRAERNTPGMASRTPNASSPHSTPPRNKTPRNTAQLEACPPASVIAARQANSALHAHPENSPTQTSPKAFHGSTATAASTTGNFPKKGRVDNSPKTYKSSPLALNPFTNKDVDQKHERSLKSAMQSTGHGHGHGHGNTTPSRFPEGQGERRLNTNGFKRSSPPTRPVSDHSIAAKMQAPVPFQQQRPPNDKSKESRPARIVSSEMNEHISRDAKLSPLMVPPLKHSGRRNSTLGSLSKPNETQETLSVGAEAEVNAEASGLAPIPVLDQVNSKSDSTRKVYQLTDGGPGNTSMQSVHRPGHSRTSSHSSYGGSSYDTADEEVLDISKAHTKMKPPQPSSPQASPEAPQHQIQVSPPRVQAQAQAQAQASNFQAPKFPYANPTLGTQIQEPAPNGTTNPNAYHISIPRTNPNPPLAPDGPIAMMRSNLVQRVKKPVKDQVLAKLFVICCSCKCWHDMPSEIYARLACPERLPSESRLIRTFSRKSSRRNAIFSSDPSGRGLPSQLRVANNSNKGAGAGPGTGIEGTSEQRNGNGNGSGASPPSVPVQCNWCGHGMTRACCQGWTTLVQMRERHH